MRMLLRVLQAVGSRRLTVAVMAALAGTMAVITVIEAVKNTKEVPFPLYLSPWFTGLLLVAWVNLACNAAYRSWWTWRKAPGILMHAGLLLVLAGGFLTWKLGIRGNVPIEEAETLRVFMPDSPVLRVSFADGSADAYFVIDKDGTFTRRSVRAALNPFGARRARTENGVPLAIHDAAPACRIAAELEDAGDAPGTPGIVVHCIGDRGALRLALLDGQTLATGGRAAPFVAYAHAGAGETAAAAERALGQAIEIAPPAGAAIRVPVSMPADAGKEFLQGAYRVKVLQYHANFKMGREPAADDPPLNPALKLHVAGPGGEKDIYAFAYLEFHGNRLDDGTVVRYERSRPGTVALVSRPDGRVELYRDAAAPPLPLNANEPAVLGAGADACAFRLIRFFPSAREVERIEPLPAGAGPPAFLLSVGEGGTPVWVAEGHGEATAPGGGATALVTNQFPLGARIGRPHDPARDGFALTLDDAVAKHWPSSQIPKAFYSLVQITDAGAAVPRHERIETNAPLHHLGFSLYQSGMDKERPYRWSSFSVAYDPGVPLVTIGFYALMAGLVWVTATRFALRRRAPHVVDAEVQA